MQKFQIFVSSTFDDLRHERDTVVRAILEMGHIPVGMEMFSAADEEQWKIIARHIDQSDYYVVVVAHRYGSVASDGQSYTRKEYEYALAQGLPVLGFVIEPSADWPADRVDKEATAVEALSEFKRRVQEKPVDFWAAAADLHGKCAVALMKAFTANPREGWVRANEVAGPAVTAELTRLSAENADLRRRLAVAESESRADYEARLRNIGNTLMNNDTTYDFRRGPRDEWQKSPVFSLIQIFGFIAPSMVTEDTLNGISNTLAMHAAGDSPWDIAAVNQVSGILADLMALEVVQPSPRKHSVKDENQYWSLSEQGRDLLRFMRQFALKTDTDHDHDRPRGDGAGVAANGDKTKETGSLGETPT